MHPNSEIVPGPRFLAQRFDEALAIRIIHEDQFAPVTAIHDVINRASILDSQLADQTGEWLWPLYVSISRTDPFTLPSVSVVRSLPEALCWVAAER